MIFATHNQNKVLEIRNLLPEGFLIQSLTDIGFHDEIPEPHDSLKANAEEKAATIYKLKGEDCFSEDTGLEIDYLNGRPGVYSARYAPTQEERIAKVLQEMKGAPNRSARFRTVICLYQKGKSYFFEGLCEGIITESPMGEGGFGYDPIFIPTPSQKSFAQMSREEKGRYSHRAKALEKLVVFLNDPNG